MGSVEILFEWKATTILHSHLLPLDKYGQVVSFLWYVGLVSSLIGVIWYFASTGDQILSLPLQI